MNSPTHWRLRHPRYHLLGTKCVGCDQPVFPPRPECPICAGRGEAQSSLIGFEVVGELPFGNMGVIHEELQEVDLTVVTPASIPGDIVS